MAMDGAGQCEQFPMILRRWGEPIGQHGVAVGRRGGRRRRAPSFHNCATVPKKSRRLTIRSASPTNSASAGIDPCRTLALDAVVGAVAVGHRLAGLVEKFFVLAVFVFLPLRRPLPHRFAGSPIVLQSFSDQVSSCRPFSPRASAAISNCGTNQYSSALASRKSRNFRVSVHCCGIHFFAFGT